MPHSGWPQAAIEGIPQTGKAFAPPAVWAAATLRRFSSRRLPQSGQTGVSSWRINNSKSLLHLRQVYSYKGIGFALLKDRED
jgi:hypothetical protein